MISFVSPSRTPTSGALWERRFSEAELLSICQRLNRDGIVILEEKLPAEIISRFLDYTSSSEASLRLLDYQVKARQEESKHEVFDPMNIKAVRYEYNMLDLCEQSFVQEILSQSFFNSISTLYLNTNPVLDIVQCWWHTNFGGVPDENAAQKYHFDMDRLKWLKVFIYLTDVGPSNGPHCFIRGSHKAGKIPWKILSRGYQRIEDSEVLSFFPVTDALEIHGEAGTIILEDTRGLHKGLHVSGKPRLMFELQYSNSLFGAPLKIPSEARIHPKPELSSRFSRIHEYIFKTH